MNTLEKTINNKYLSPEMYVLSNNNCKCISLSNTTNKTKINNFTYPNKKQINKDKTLNYINNATCEHLLYLCE